MAQKGMKGLLEWCKKHTEGYKDVDVKNMSSSWKDGLAFCALLHRFRPDLIDFDTLSKENVLYNNQLAFGIAENELGIAALLDAEDMANMKIPDRLSIMTYLSQYYSCFRNCEPVEANAEHAVVNPVGAANTLDRQKKSSMESLCSLCGKRVHLVQRYFEDGKLYHRTCHRNNSLEQIRGKNYFIKHQPDENAAAENTTAIDGASHANAIQSVSVPKVARSEQNDKTSSKPELVDGPTNPEILTTGEVQPVAIENSHSPAKVEEKSGNSSEATDLSSSDSKSSNQMINSASNKIAFPKAKARTLPASQKNYGAAPAPAARPRTKTQNDLKNGGSTASSDKDYDESLNPFGSDDSDAETLSSTSTDSDTGANPFVSSAQNPALHSDAKKEHAETDSSLKNEESESENEGNPFGDDDIDEVEDDAGYGNPFGDSGEEEENPTVSSQPRPSPSNRFNPFSKEYSEDSISADEKKKRPAPVPPKKAPPRPASSPAQKIGVAAPKKAPTAPKKAPAAPKKAPAPPPPTWKLQAAQQMAQMNSSNDSDPRFRNNQPVAPKSPSKPPTSPVNKMDRFKLRRMTTPKARAAPGYGHPLVKRKVKIKMTEDEITTELKLLDVKLTDYETKGVKLEEMLRFAMTKEVEWTSEEDELLNEWFDLVNKKNILLREESDLVFQLQQQRLEQEHADIEFELRKLLNKPESSKTEKDKKEEEELLQKLVEVVERRNVIINSIEEERLKEAEEDSAYNQMKLMKANTSKKKKKNKVKKMFSKKDKKEKKAQPQS